MGKMLKAVLLASGSYVATGLNPFTNKTAAEAYEEKYAEVMAGGGDTTNIENGDNIQGDTTQSENNTKILNEGSDSKQDSVVIVNDS